MTGGGYGQQGEQDDADAILVDHSLVINNPRTNLWPIAIGSIAIILVLAGAASAFFQRESMEDQITGLSQELLASRKSVERLIAENALLERKLNALSDRAESDFPLIHSESSAGMNSADLNSKDTVEETAGQSKEPSGEIVAATPEPEIRAVMEPDSATGFSDVMGQSSSPPDTAQSAGRSQSVFAPSEKNPDATSADPGNGLGPWAVVVGAFSNSSNLNKLVSALEVEDYRVTTQGITREGRELQQVKVIGFNSKSDAIAAANAIELTYKTGPLRVAMDPVGAWTSGPDKAVSRAPLKSPSRPMASSSEKKTASSSSATTSNTDSTGAPSSTG